MVLYFVYRRDYQRAALVRDVWAKYDLSACRLGWDAAREFDGKEVGGHRKMGESLTIVGRLDGGI